MKTKPFIIVNSDGNDDYYDHSNYIARFPDVDGSMIWHLTNAEARDVRLAISDYDSPIRDHGYVLLEVIEPIQESRDIIQNAVAEIRAAEAQRQAEAQRRSDQAKAAAEARRVKAAEKKLKKETETKEQLYLRLKAEFEGEGQ